MFRKTLLLLVFVGNIACATSRDATGRARSVSWPQEHDLTVNGARLHYLQWGSSGKPALVILTGTGGLGGIAQQWRDFAEHISADYDVFAPEMRGTAESDWTGPYTWRQVVEDIDAFVDHLHLDRVVLLGHSAGAHWGFAYVAAHAEKVTQFVAVDPGGDPWHWRERNPPQPTFKSPAEAYTFAKERWGISDKVEPTLRQIIALGVRKREDGSFAWTIDPQAVATSTWFPGTQALQFYPKIRVPTLLIRGEKSPWAADIAKHIAAEIPAARLVEIPGAGHVVHLSNPDEFARVVCEFLHAACARSAG